MNERSLSDTTNESERKAEKLVEVPAKPERPRRRGNRRKLDGRRFGRLVVIRAHDKLVGKRWYALCQCDCGKTCHTGHTKMLTGWTTSCGCFRLTQHITHGMAKSPTYCSWHHMMQRSTNPNNGAFEYYLGRGITVCERWEKFENFLSDMGERPTGTTIHRKNPNGNYEPNNCVWATRKQQMEGRRDNILLTHNGETLCLKQWSVRTGIKYRTLAGRFEAGLSVPDMLTQPVRYGSTWKSRLREEVPKKKK